MTRPSHTKRSYQRRPGIISAARELGCSYGHLRMCVAGDRQSEKLLARFRAWKRQQRTARNSQPETTQPTPTR